MNELEQRIWNQCQNVLIRQRWNHFRDITVKKLPHESPTPFMAYIQLDNFNININVVPHFEAVIRQAQSKNNLKIPTSNILDSFLHFVMTHEYGHYRHCPATKEHFEAMMQGIFEAIQGKELHRERIESLCGRIQNMFSDTVMNALNAHTDIDMTQYRDGLAYTYLIAGEYRQMQAGNFLKRWAARRSDKTMALFLDTNRALCDVESSLGKK